jgi:hypothetical protein
MITPSEFLLKLCQQLKSFSSEEQVELIEEISSHIESVEQDHAFGSDADIRRKKLMAELGSPEEMGKSFKKVHRPNRFLDFLLAFVPVYLVFPFILPILYHLMGAPKGLNNSLYRLDIRLTILIGFLLTLIAIKRHSPLLLAFWFPDVISRTITLMTREQRWTIGHEVVPGSYAWLESFFGMYCWPFWRLVWANYCGPTAVTC